MDNENQRELDVLAALEGIHRMQESIRDTQPDKLEETGATPEQRRSLGDRLASDAAVAQVIRAANVYRERLGYGPLESEVEA